MIRSSNYGSEIYDYKQNANTFTVEPGDYYETGAVQGSGFIMVMDHNWNLIGDYPGNSPGGIG